MKRNKITLLLAAFLLVCGCSDFEEINVNMLLLKQCYNSL